MPESGVRRAPRLLAAGVVALLASALPLRSQELQNGCPFHEGNLERDGNTTQMLRSPEAFRGPPGIRFSHTSALTPGEVEVPLPPPHQVSRPQSSGTQAWEIIQLVVILATAFAVVWLAHRKLEY